MNFTKDSRKQDEELQVILDSVPVLIFYKDKNNRFLKVNKTFAESIGMEKEKVEGESLFNLFPDEQAKLFWQDDKRVIKSGKPKIGIIEQAQTADGLRWFRTDKIPYRNKNGEIIGVIGFAVDITGHKKTEEDLKSNELRLKSAERTAKVGSWELNLLTNKLIWSDEVFRIFEIDKNKFDASYKEFLNLVYPEDRKLVDKAYINSLKTKAPYDIVHRLQFSDGRIKYVREICETYFDKKNTPIKSIGSVQDITEQINTEKELDNLASFPRLNPNPILEINMKGQIIYANPTMLKLFPDIRKRGMMHPMFLSLDLKRIKKDLKLVRREVYAGGRWYDQSIIYVPEIGNIRIYNIDITERKKLEQQKDEFIAIASHELKTPLTSIKAFIQILSKWSQALENKTIPKIVARVDEQVNKLTNLVINMLDETKIQAGQLVYEKELFNLDLLIKEVVYDVCVTDSGHKYRVKVIGKAGKKITGDRYRIGQVFANLLTNAMKYSTPGNIMVKITPGKDQMIVCVRDFGKGIAKKELGKIFNRYYRAHSAKKTNENFASLGLGLYISAEIIKRHGGRIWVESELGKGSAFYFSLPVKLK